MNYFGGSIGNDDEADQRKFNPTRDALIKFVRNDPPTLCWFRSDLNTDILTMLRMERRGIE